MPTPRPKHDRVVETACPLDCPDSCSLLVRDSGGRVVGIDGSRRNPVTAGFICSKVRQFGERVNGPLRVRHPMVRVGPKGNAAFSRVTWEEAIDLVATRIKETRDTFGGEAILPFCYGGSNGLLTQDATDARLFRRPARQAQSWLWSIPASRRWHATRTSTYL
jgi:anaerobic selenocysteine-containing dehydrogenase